MEFRLNDFEMRVSVDDVFSAKKNFDQFGFCIVENFFSCEQLEDFKNDVISVVNCYLNKAGLQGSGSDQILSTGILMLESVSHDYVAAIYDTVFNLPSFQRITADRRIESLTRQLLNCADSSCFYGFTQRCRIAPPKDERRTYGWHQEVFYSIPRARFLQTWAPLIFPTSVQNGTIEVAVGSHKEGIIPQSWIEIDGRSTQIICDETVLSNYQAVSLCMQPGELLFFSPLLAHRSGSNSSDEVRYSLVGMYHDVSVPEFISPKINFEYRAGTPKEYFIEHFGEDSRWD